MQVQPESMIDFSEKEKSQKLVEVCYYQYLVEDNHMFFVFYFLFIPFLQFDRINFD